MRRGHAAIEPQRADQCLRDIAEDIVAFARAIVARLFAEPDHRLQVERAGDIGADFTGDEAVEPGGKLPLLLAREAAVEFGGDHQPEHAVT